MKLKDLTKEELEAMSYDDIAAMVLTEKNKQMKINDLFKEVCRLLGLSDEEFMEKLPAFFEVLSTDQRFIMLPKGLWDLKAKHSIKVVIDNDDESLDIDEDEVEDMDDEMDMEDENNSQDDIYADDDDALDDDPEEDDIKDLVIVDDDDDEANGE
jgi:DNA-directed RNA polymerase subunit delta